MKTNESITINVCQLMWNTLHELPRENALLFEDVKKCDLEIMSRLKLYTKEIFDSCHVKSMDEMRLETIISDYADNLMDAIDNSNYACFQSGLRVGADIVYQLLLDR